MSRPAAPLMSGHGSVGVGALDTSETGHAGLTVVGIGWRHPHYQELLAQRPGVDFLEVHSENFFAQGGAALAVLTEGRAHYPISLHGVGLSLGSAMGLDDWHLEQLASLVNRIEPVRVSDHACFARAFFDGQVAHASDLLPIPFSRESLDVLCANVQRVQDRLKRPFMVENLSAYLRWHTPELARGDDTLSATQAETEFLSELARRTGCNLLVDVNNIYVNALNQRLTAAQAIDQCRAWLDGIAPQSVAEIHLAGHCHVNDAHGDIVIDDHGSPVCDGVWAVYQHAIARFGAVPTLVEWDTDVPALDVLLGEVTTARRAMRQALLALPGHAETPRRMEATA
jgi:uncharacterized protein